MPRSLEIAHYADLIASLTITAARTDNTEALIRLHAELRDAYRDVFTLISHDALGAEPVDDAEEAALMDTLRDGGVHV